MSIHFSPAWVYLIMHINYTSVCPIFLIIFLFANTSPGIHICICNHSFLSTQIFLFAFFLLQTKYFHICICPFVSTRIYSYSYLSKNNKSNNENKHYELYIMAYMWFSLHTFIAVIYNNNNKKNTYGFFYCDISCNWNCTCEYQSE